jgi:hypothetical protein
VYYIPIEFIFSMSRVGIYVGCSLRYKEERKTKQNSLYEKGGGGGVGAEEEKEEEEECF